MKVIERRNIGVGHFESTPEMVSNLMQVMRTGRISYGPFSQQFEKEFAEAHDSLHAVLSASGTDSLRVALHALMIERGWKCGDEIIVPATTFVATINVVEQLNLVPVLVDVDPVHYCMDPKSAIGAINNDTVCIMPVNLLGQSAELSLLASIAEDNHLMMVEDSCEAMFVNHMGFPVGSWGNIGVFSLYMAHLITGGVGGIAITDSTERASLMRSLVNHGRSPEYISIDDDDGLEGDELVAMIRQRYAFIHQGYSSRITELQAAIALPQLHNYQDMLARRYAVASRLTAGLRKHSKRLQLPAEREESEHAYMMYGIRMRNGENKWPLMKYLEERGIETREMLPIVNQKMYAPLTSTATKRGESLAVSRDLIRTGFYIGCHQGMTDADADYVCEVINGFFK